MGTYFYTHFPAYPYLALNGPKNSGKSTVLRVLQPLAFNMITTSDPTGPSMFRLIHHTSCTVGINEAERYHNPRDPGMQQIRQLLNSPVLPGFMGTLDGEGLSTAQLNLPPLPPGYVGTIVHFAYALLSPYDYVSNPVAIELVP